MIDVEPQHLLDIECFGAIVDQRNIIDGKGILQTCKAVQLIDDNIAVGVFFQVHNDPHSFSVGFVPDI